MEPFQINQNQLPGGTPVLMDAPEPVRPSAFVTFVTGQSPANLVTERSRNSISLLAVYSLFICLAFASVVTWYFQMQLDMLVAALIVGVAVFVFLLLINKSFYQFFEKNKWLAISIYLLLYGLLCLLIIPQPFVYQYYSTVIEKGSNIDAWTRLSEKLAGLNGFEKKALRKFEFTVTTIAFLFPVINVAIYILILKQQQANMDKRKEAFLLTTQQQLLQKQMEYTALFNNKKSHSDDPFFIEGSDDTQTQAKADKLMAEIMHLKFCLQKFQ